MSAIASFPPLEVRGLITHEQWMNTTRIWRVVLNQHRKDLDAGTATISAKASLINYLYSYYEALAQSSGEYPEIRSQIGGVCYEVLVYFLQQSQPSSKLLSASFLSCVLRVHPLAAADTRFTSAYQCHTLDVASLQPSRKQATQALLSSSKNDERRVKESTSLLAEILGLAMASIDAARFFAASPELLESLCVSYHETNDASQQKDLALLMYILLTSLLKESKAEKPSLALLLDQLYSVEQWTVSRSDGQGATPSLLRDLVRSTPLLVTLRSLAGDTKSARADAVIDSLSKYALHSDGGGMKDPTSNPLISTGHVDDSLHMHQMSVVSQVQELFPELATGIILRLLDKYGDNVEELTAHYLEGTIPPELLFEDATTALTAPASRKGRLDGDELDRLAVSADRLHIGKRSRKNDLPPEDPRRKAAIWSALSAMESDDDEEDDTYQQADVGGSVDTAGPDELHDDPNEEALFGAWQTDPNLFARDSATRRSQYRMQLKHQLGMTDETIEGWALMLGRDPKKIRRLELKYSRHTGAQSRLRSNRWTANEEEPSSSDPEAAHSGGQRPVRGGVQAGNRGASSPRARGRKEANKGAIGNHHRRDQRAKKMARGGFGVP